jgi:alpha-L-fucosidase
MKMNFRKLRFPQLFIALAYGLLLRPASGEPDTQWFREAKFGIFIHWGLYSELGNEWRGKDYFGSGEWIMNRAKIPAADYAQVASRFDPTNFDAETWARLVKESGARYLVITAKHHEGFAMFDSRVSPFNIVDATPYHQDPMKALADACRGEGLKFGFYYSQFLDWHEPNGGGNTWDFPRDKKNYRSYYAQKSIPQIKELLSNYGPLGLIWFDMPGGLNREETLSFMGEVRKLQPDCLISSRVGNGLGDFRDLGDSEMPSAPVGGPWEALFTHNDSWGYVNGDSNFKTPRDILHLLASTAALGGNLILNVGPDGTGRIPEISRRYLREVGNWLAVNGESIYGTTHSPIPGQPWGVATLKTNRLYLHVFERPNDGVLFVPGFNATVKNAAFLVDGKTLKTEQQVDDLKIFLPANLPDPRDTVVAVDFSGALPDKWQSTPPIISGQFDSFTVGAARAQATGQTVIKSLTSSRYFGNWKHDTCAVNMQKPADGAEFVLRFLEPGDYHMTLEYACVANSKDREGVVQIGDQPFRFQTLVTAAAYDSHEPLLFVRHSIGIFNIGAPGVVPVEIHPLDPGTDLFWLRSLIIEPVSPGLAGANTASIASQTSPAVVPR